MKFAFDDNSVVVVIGSGAGGATVANELCARGVKVVLLEAGPHIGIAEFRNDEFFAYNQLTWLDKRRATGDWPAAKYAPETPAWIVKAVGGSTLHWNGLSFRIQDREFRARTEYGELDGASLADWPITARELDPFYDRAEDKMGVTGTHGIQRHPPNNNYKVLYNGARRIGYKSIDNDRLAINSEARDGRPGCIQLGFCNQGCRVDARWTTLSAEIPDAEKSGNLDLRPQSMALQLVLDKRDRIQGVLYADVDGEQHLQQARLVCVAGNSIETPRLLLNSATSRHPDGLANSSGQVGRNYMHHNSALAFGVFDEPVHMYRGITTPGTVFDENQHDPERGFAGGYLIESVSLGLPFMSFLAVPNGWGRDYAWLMDQYDHMAGVLLVGEDLPREQNQVRLHHDEKDQYGLPIPEVHVEEHPNELAMRNHFYRQSQAIFEAVGATHVHQAVPFSAAHNLGTCRMSENPENGVVNSRGQSHEIDNLFISDGSVFATSTCENPTLTIVALAIRQADYIVREMSLRAL